MEFSRLEPGQPALDELVQFVAELNRDQAQQIGYLDDDPAQIATFLAGHSLPPHQSWVVAREGGRLAGAFGFEADPEVGRAWLYGPFVRHASWDAIADRLWAEVQALLPADLREHELFYNVQNANGLAFAERHGFPLHGDAIVLRFGRESLVGLLEASAQELAPAQHEAFQMLHDRIFPQTYYSGRQIVGRISEQHKVFVVAEGEQLLGYAYVEVLPEFGEGNVEFIGVDDTARGRGVGTRLLASALRWMFAFPSMQ
jgi:GNAT superfamily N-acetyltransferase